MSEQQKESKPDVRGTWQDWPVALVVVALGLALFLALTGGKPLPMLLIAAAFGLLWAIRGGVFTPRKR